MDGVDDACLAPMAFSYASRHLAVAPTPGSDSVALLVTGDPDDPDASCVSSSVQANATLDASPILQTPDDWGAVHVADEQMVPGAVYSIRVDFGAPGDPALTISASAMTLAWGDLNDDGIVNGRDLLIFIDAYLTELPYSIGDLCSADGLPDGTPPEVPDRHVDGDDLLCWIEAYYGKPYPFGTCEILGSRAPIMPDRPPQACRARLAMVPRTSHASPGQPVSIDVFLQGARNLRLYQVAIDILGGAHGELVLQSVSIDEARDEFVFAGHSPATITDADQQRVVSALWEGDVDHVGKQRYLATFAFVPSRDAGGVFTLRFRAEPGTMLRDSDRQRIRISSLSEATIRVDEERPTQRPSAERQALRRDSQGRK